MDDSNDIAACAARWVVEDGLDFSAAKQRARRDLGSPKAPLPDNAQLEAAVRDYIAVFCPEPQAHALHALRELALQWMQRLQVFRPHITGAVWHGYATAHSDVHLDLYCDDPKSAEIALIDQGAPYRVGTRAVSGHASSTNVLSLQVACPALQRTLYLHLHIHDYDDLRGALRPDHQGRRERGNAQALHERLHPPAHQPRMDNVG